MAHEILIVDDETDLRASAARILEEEGFDSRKAATSDQLLDAVETRRPALVLLDVGLEGGKLDGIDALRALKRLYPNLPVVMMSTRGAMDTALEALRIGAIDFVEKPLQGHLLSHVIRRTMEMADLRRDNEELRLHSVTDGALFGDSSAVDQLRRDISTMVATDGPILIDGPWGSGKRVAARHIHGQSKRANGPFIVVDRASLASGQADEILFGSENREGDCQTIQLGLFERAHSGTLFLQEIAGISRKIQEKILGVLLNRSFVRGGGRCQVNVDVRIIAASSHDLGQAIANGRLREDLVRCLGAGTISVPSLAQRREDIPDLCNHVMNSLSVFLGRPTRVFSDDAMALLKSHNWPGNLRELTNTIECMLIHVPGRSARLVSWLDLLSRMPVDRRVDIGTFLGLPIREAREVFERKYLKFQLARFDGNLSRIAHHGGLERSSLVRPPRWRTRLEQILSESLSGS